MLVSVVIWFNSIAMWVTVAWFSCLIIMMIILREVPADPAYSVSSQVPVWSWCNAVSRMMSVIISLKTSAMSGVLVISFLIFLSSIFTQMVSLKRPFPPHNFKP